MAIFHAHNYEAPLAAFLGRRTRSIPLFYSAHTLLEEELPAYFGGPHRKRFARLAGKLLDRSVPRLADHAIALDTRTENGFNNSVVHRCPSRFQG